MTTPTTTPTTTARSNTTGLRRRARAAVARSAAGDRSLVVLVGGLLLVAGTLVALLSYGVFGTGRSARPLLDPIILDTLRAQPLPFRLVAIVGGLLLAVLGVVWAARSVRPESRPDLHLTGVPDTRIVIDSTAAADAIGRQAAGLAGVGRARARLVGPEHAPALRVTLWLADDADVGAVLAALDEQVLAGARESLELGELPVAVRLELDAVTPPPRVA
ncbi:alkaline shock response membrane anchor protein AmaP [Pseudonocardia lacus]|uniref:alkaline shock response membrane anchor protein AmaP n=1 Tax=Pseudonocardia lacus TaxID=2835865 RepID=UPI0027E2A28F|nr:alkaline shock response membrane anchor protein AmaP [Pseudonocardia lacus]